MKRTCSIGKSDTYQAGFSIYHRSNEARYFLLESCTLCICLPVMLTWLNIFDWAVVKIVDQISCLVDYKDRYFSI